MAESWNTERVLALAPDASSAKAGQGQAKANKWPALGRSGAALWGEVQGSGSKPYQVRVDLGEPAFKCSCPSRKFPCKHALGLMLLMVDQPSAIAEAQPPEWVSEWLDSRADRAAKQQAKAEAKAEAPVDAQAQAKRAAKREEKVLAGIDELGRMLADIARQGLAAAQSHPMTYWEQAAARMVDAQAPGLARLVRELGQTVGAGDSWQSRFMRRLGRLHLAVQGYARLETLPIETQADLRTLVGWTLTRDELLTQPGVSDAWCVLGQAVEEDDRIRTQRTWLLGRNTGRSALVLDFAVGNQPLDTSLVVGSAFDAELVYYPGVAPLRAIVKERQGELQTIASLPAGSTNVADAFDAYADALAANPWLERWPMLLSRVAPVAPGKAAGWQLRDEQGHALALSPAFRDGWTLLSVSGGRPISIFGEWDGEALLPMGVGAAGGYFTWPRDQSNAMLARVS